MNSVDGRGYRFAPLDHTGWFLGLTVGQCLGLGGAIVFAAFALTAGLALPLALVPVAIGAVFGFVRVRGRSMSEWFGVGVSWIRLGSRRTWCVPLERLGDPTALPPFLAGIELVEVEAPDWVRARRVGGVGLVVDRAQRAVTVVMRVQGRTFALRAPEEQDRAVLAWGDALAAVCRERHPVARVTWSEHSSPVGLASHRTYVESIDAVASEVRDDYLQLVSEAGPMTIRHEVVVALTVDATRVRIDRTRHRDPLEGVAHLALSEARLLTQRLQAAALVVDPPCSPEGLRTLVRDRIEAPAALVETTSKDTANDGVTTFAPLGVDAAFEHFRVGRTWHRSYWVAGWPRLVVAADWMAPAIMHAGGVRTMTVIYQPVPLSRSHRGVDRDATKLAADEAQRSRSGFRVGARQRRAVDEVHERERELVSGYAEFHYCGFVTVSAPNHETLERDCAEFEQVAARVGLELRALVGQHDLGLGATLPIGRYPARRVG